MARGLRCEKRRIRFNYRAGDILRPRFARCLQAPRRAAPSDGKDALVFGNPLEEERHLLTRLAVRNQGQRILDRVEDEARTDFEVVPEPLTHKLIHERR